MNYNLIHDKKYTTEFGVVFENEFIELYNRKILSLHEIPHKYRSSGFFYDECLRLGEFTLIPSLTSEERARLKNDYDKSMSSLNRVDALSLQLIRVAVNDHFYRALVYQVLSLGMYLSEEIREKLHELGKKVEELSKEELFFVCKDFIRFLDEKEKVYVYMFIPEIEKKGFTVQEIKEISKDKSNFFLNLKYDSFPTLFTNVYELSFDQGGLVKLEFFQDQMYQLYTFRGDCLTYFCQDLEIMVNGQYLLRECGNEPGFHLYQYNFITKNEYYKKTFGDLSGVLDDILPLSKWDYNQNLSESDQIEHLHGHNNRDRVAFDSDGFPFARVENFNKPENREEVIQILKKQNTNWIFSPELVNFYENDKELAQIAISRDKRAYTIISNELQKDPDLIRLILNFQFCNEYNLKPEEYLQEDEINKLFRSNPKVIKFLSEKYRSDKR